MTARHAVGKWVAVALATVMLTLPIAPAFADETTPPVSSTIASGVVVAGIDLSGMTADQAVATLTAGVATPTLAPLAVNATGTIFTLAAVKAVDLDVAGLVRDALVASQPVDIPARYLVDDPAVRTFVKGIATHIDRTMLNAKRKIVKRRLKVSASRVGRQTDTSRTVAAVKLALASELSAGGASQATVTAPVKALKPTSTVKTLGKTIVVVLKERRVYLYHNGAKIEKKYRCAVGMPAHPTPKGIWKIVRKVKNPSWYNNGAAWAAHMPAFIGPGPNNPLGTRALYLNAPGIRIHGIPAHENSSIGHAASHGCIRLKNSNAVNLYPRVKVGTVVYIIK